MCMCEKPTINGEPGYSWDGKSVSVRQPAPPQLQEGDALIYDLPGRCGHGCDSHCHHFRVVKNHTYALLVCHGGGEERIELGSRHGVKVLESLDDEGRYWFLQMLYHVQAHASRVAAGKVGQRWLKAAAEKRIKTRKKRGGIEVRIMDEEVTQQT